MKFSSNTGNKIARSQNDYINTKQNTFHINSIFLFSILYTDFYLVKYQGHNLFSLEEGHRSTPYRPLPQKHTCLLSAVFLNFTQFMYKTRRFATLCFKYLQHFYVVNISFQLNLSTYLSIYLSIYLSFDFVFFICIIHIKPVLQKLTLYKL